MITLFATARHSHTISAYLAGRGKPLASWIRLMTYEAALRRGTFRAGTYIFTDIDRLQPNTRKLAAMLHQRLAAEDGFTLLNDPLTSLTRHHLLRRLRSAGVNDFDAYPVRDADVLRFPVFVRHKIDHKGPLTPLLHSDVELKRAIRELLVRGITRDNLLVVEFSDTSDENGIYRKYAAFCIGSRIVPRGIFFSRAWRIKHRDLMDESKAEEELAYVQGNPHESRLREIFELAGIQYGRIDYAVVDTEVRVWEINLNPTLQKRPGRQKKAPRHLMSEAARSRHLELLQAAFEAIDSSAPGSVEFRPSQRLLVRSAYEMKRDDAGWRWSRSNAGRATRLMSRVTRGLVKRGDRSLAGS